MSKGQTADRLLLFTGFPGFIGARLLPRLLELRPDVELRCLVQERFLETARSSIADIARAHPHTRGRITTAVGDITQPRLGLDASEARDLQKQLSGCYHLAAVYDLAVSREVGQRINVVGTRNVLELLAGAKRLEELHYVSTAYVSGTAVGVYKETDLDVGQSFKNHYEETKFLAEVEVVKAGLPTTTYRPGIVVGDSQTGETAKFDGPYFALAAMWKLPSPGLFLKVGSGRQTINLVPIDFVMEALARLSSQAESRGKTYHLTNPEPPTVLEVEEIFARALGKSFAYIPVPMAVGKAFFAPRVVQRFLGMPAQALDYFDHPCRYDCSQASAALEPLGIRCARFQDYAPRLVAFYRTHRDDIRRGAMI
jgi:thioester reductase-like protein